LKDKKSHVTTWYCRIWWHQVRFCRQQSDFQNSVG